jgi:membrane protein YdbS with pleckstrin-like domain
MDPNPPASAHRAYDPAAILAIERPHRKLMTYSFICCLLTGPLFPIVILPNFFRYHTMRYRFDAEGISMRWGIVFHCEVILNYARIQDIHLVSNILERWLGLARIQIQTASGSANAEMTLEGLLDFEAVRDFLYSRMRGVKEAGRAARGARHPAAAGDAVVNPNTVAELTATLRAVGEELRDLRQALEQRKSR